MQHNEMSAKDYNARGEIHYENRELVLASRDYTAAIALDPNYALAYLNRGSVYFEQGEFTDAMSDYTTALRLDPDNALGYLKRALVSIEQEAYDNALSDYAKALTLVPNKADIYRMRANVYGYQDKLGEAMSNYVQALLLDPENQIANDDFSLLLNKPEVNARTIFDAITPLSKAEAILLLAQCLDEKTLLGQKMRSELVKDQKQELSFFSSSMDTGPLKRMHDYYKVLIAEKMVVREVAWTLAQGSRSTEAGFVSPFSQLPDEIGVMIAAFVAKDLAPEVALKIARKHYDRPQVPRV
jgi:tetratricopeptide (TPR) repeat protein